MILHVTVVAICEFPLAGMNKNNSTSTKQECSVSIYLLLLP